MDKRRPTVKQKASAEKNLKPGFQPGQSGNPAGRKKNEHTITAMLRVRLDEVDPKTGKTGAQMVADKLYELAIGGNLSAIQEVLDRVQGRVPQPQKLEHTGDVVIRVIEE